MSNERKVLLSILLAMAAVTALALLLGCRVTGPPR